MAAVETSSLQELVQRKENECREAQELQIKSLQSALNEKERHLNNKKLRFRKLKEDFEYNLKLFNRRERPGTTEIRCVVFTTKYKHGGFYRKRPIVCHRWPCASRTGQK